MRRRVRARARRVAHYLGADVVLTRWKVSLAFFGLMLASAAGLYVLTLDYDRSARAADKATSVSLHADRLARRIDLEQAARRALRAAQIAALHRTDVKYCDRIHELDAVAIAATLRGIAFDRTLHIPGVDPEALVLEAQRTLRDLRGADCVAVKPLPQRPPKTPPKPPSD